MWYQHIYILSHADESAFYKNWAVYKKVLFESDLALLYINIKYKQIVIIISQRHGATL